jgi:hypothetical protein
MRKNCKTVISFEDNERKALMINVQMNHMESVVRRRMAASARRKMIPITQLLP